VKNKFFIISVIFIIISFPIFGSSQRILVDHTCVDYNDNVIPQSALDEARKLKVSWAHNSIGNDIVAPTTNDHPGGMAWLASEVNATRYSYNIIDYYQTNHTPVDPGAEPGWFSDPDSGGIVNWRLRSNDKPWEKRMNFILHLKRPGETIDGWDDPSDPDYDPEGDYDDDAINLTAAGYSYGDALSGSDIGVAMMKYGHLDTNDEGSGILDVTWPRYRDMMAELEIHYPGITFVWVTMPLTASCSSGGNSLRRHQLNEAIRDYTADHNEVLFDLADIESHYYDSGSNQEEPFCSNPDEEGLYPDYSDDGKHLRPYGSDGQIRVARAFWWMLARVAGWNGPDGETDPGSIQFGSNDYEVDEEDGSVSISVTRISGSDGAASVEYTVSGGSASPGVDFSASNGSLNWADGESSTKYFHISINPDLIYEGDETIDLTLSNAQVASMGSPSQVQATIIDYDFAVFETRVNGGENDAQEDMSSNLVSIDDLQLTMIDDYIIGMRFTDVRVPQGATILNSYIQLQSAATSVTQTDLTIAGEDINHALAFTDDDSDIMDRNETSASEDWDISASWENGDFQRTPNISDVVQEIVNRNGWEIGNAMMLAIYGDGNRSVIAYEGNPSASALLHIEYQGNNTVQITEFASNQFNMTSFHISPSDPSMSGIVQNLNCLRLIKDDLGRFYLPDQGVDTIGNIEIGKGYWFYLDCEETLEIQGTPLDPTDHSMTLQPHFYNLIPYLQRSTAPVAEQLASIENQLVLVQDHIGNFWIPDVANLIDQNGGMRPGYGYQVYIQGDDPINFTYPISARGGVPTQALALSQISQRETVHFEFSVTGLPHPMILTHASFLDEGELQAGDEIGVFDGLVCVGGVAISEKYIQGNRVSFNVWQAASEYGLLGFTPGHQMRFKVWRQTLGECSASAEFEKGCSEFGSGIYSLFSLKISEEPENQLDETASLRYELSRNYPNPFYNPTGKRTTKISYQIPENKAVSLKVYNISGQLIRTLTDCDQPAGQHEAEWDGRDRYDRQAAAGIYFYRLRTDDYKAVGRMLLIR